jgi:hypothetical protein
VHPVAVGLSRTSIGEVPVPDVAGAFPQLDPPCLSGVTRLLEEAQLHPRCVLREHREVGTLSVPRRAQGGGDTRPDPRHGMHRGLNFF